MQQVSERQRALEIARNVLVFAFAVKLAFFQSHKSRMVDSRDRTEDGDMTAIDEIPGDLQSVKPCRSIHDLVFYWSSSTRINFVA